MSNEPTGGGNPNFFSVFKGRYSLAPLPPAAIDNSTVMLSIVNDVQICGDIELSEYVPDSEIATLPIQCSPDSMMKIPVAVTRNSPTLGETCEVLIIDSDGKMSLNSAVSSGIVHTNGISFNISGNFYKEV